jgi:hypothetical protein
VEEAVCGGPIASIDYRVGAKVIKSCQTDGCSAIEDSKRLLQSTGSAFGPFIIPAALPCVSREPKQDAVRKGPSINTLMVAELVRQRSRCSKDCQITFNQVFSFRGFICFIGKILSIDGSGERIRIRVRGTSHTNRFTVASHRHASRGRGSRGRVSHRRGPHRHASHGACIS